MASLASSVLNNIAKLIYENNADAGFWDYEGVPEHMVKTQKISLIHSELSEAVEGLRMGNPPDDKVPEYESDAVEMADAFIRIMDYCGRYDIPIGDVVLAKLEMNKTRPHKHGKLF